MKHSTKLCLGIDTSNYTTSVAIVDDDFNILCDSRKILDVKQGDRGLRQSQALFEHVGNLPEVIEKSGFKIGDGNFAVVAVSDRPRRVEGSYMPVFKAGEAVGRSFASLAGTKYFTFSHQEGHIAAALIDSGFESRAEDGEEFLSLHLSGGTTEMLKCRKDFKTGGYETEIVGGTRDISLGQLIDRVGVSLGFKFPCGAAMDKYALKGCNEKDPEFCKIKTEDGFLNASGIETQIQRYIKERLADEVDEELREHIPYAMFSRIGVAINNMIKQGQDKTGIKAVLVAGGVSSSVFLRKLLCENEDIFLGKERLSSDNAVGTAVLGMKRYLKNEANTSFTVE